MVVVAVSAGLTDELLQNTAVAMVTPVTTRLISQLAAAEIITIIVICG